VTAPDPADIAATDRDQPAPGPWTCPRCDSERAAEDDFCGRCGAPRPTLTPAGGETPGARQRDGFPVARALILNGVIVVAVVLAVVLGGNGGPGIVRFEPATWRCDGTERAWIATIPARATDLRIEWRTGGPVGEVRASTGTPREALERYATADGSFRVTTSESTAPECALAPGTWTLAIRDASDNALLASGDVVLAAP
jgi:hypothetical protein